MKKEMSTNEDSNVAAKNSYIQLQKSQVVRENIHGISKLLNTGLNEETLDICIKLIEAGVHPQVLADVVNQLRKEVTKDENA